MRYRIISIFLILLFISCKKQSQLSEKFNCSNFKIENSIEVLDFNKNFKMTIPSNWKSNLYFSEFESEIFTADTLKQLTKSFILGTSFNLGSLDLDSNFHEKVDSTISKNNLQIINSGSESFQSKPTYWYVTKGVKNGFTHHQFNLIAKLSENSYFKGYSEVYGDTNIEDRICESISILEKIEFLQ